MAVRSGRRAAKQPAEVRRETLVEAAIRVFARTSYRAAGTAEIAREAGVAEPTIYRHFDSKRDLYLAALRRCGTIVQERFARIDEQTPLAHEALAAMGAWYREAMETDPVYLRLRQRALAETDDPEIQLLLRDTYEEILAIFTRVVKRGQEQGTIKRAIDAPAAAWLFLAIGHTMDLSRLIDLGDDPGEDGCFGMTGLLKQALLAPGP
jgi:AcrR family transcriptional regulator